jgi:hypothetical protein
MSKMQSLQTALNRSTGKTAQELTASEPIAPTTLVAGRQSSRAGQVNISSWLPADFKSSLRLVQARKRTNATLQDLMAEALNDLFIKYDVPTIRQD